MLRKPAILFFATLLCCSVAAAAEHPSDAEIRALVAENLRATQANDLDAILLTIHPDSPAQLVMGRSIDALKAYKLNYEAVSVGFVCMSGEYALVRIVQRTTRVAGPDFLDNEVDGIWALRQDGTRWKYWTQLVLKVSPLSRPAAAKQ
jgi:hypothetical protein